MNFVRTATSVAALAVLLTLTGCGSDDDAGATDTATSTPSQDAGATPPAGGGFDEAQLEEIRECLDAAGLEDVFPTDMPSGAPSDRPTDLPEDFDPENLPEDFDPENLPEGFPSEGAGGQGGGLAALQDPEVQDALEACGIELPQAPTSSPS